MGKETPTANSSSTPVERVSLDGLRPGIHHDLLWANLGEETNQRTLRRSRRNPVEELEGVLETTLRHEQGTHEIVKSSLQAKEEVSVSRLGHTGDCTIGQNQVETNGAVNRKSTLIGPVGRICWSIVSVQGSETLSGTNRRRVGGHLCTPVTVAGGRATGDRFDCRVTVPNDALYLTRESLLV